YFTGNLDVAARAFGFQLTFFRFAISPTKPQSNSRWRSQQVLLAHFAITDVHARRFYAHERLHRETLGIAGFTTYPMAVWINDWRIEFRDDPSPAWRLTATAGAQGLALDLTPQKRLVLLGDRGLSQKGRGAGNASYYYAQPRLAAAGRLTVLGQSHAVTGVAWLDREWGSGALEAAQSGWDWFGLHLDNQCEFSFYRLRRSDRAADPHSAGVWIGMRGDVVALRAADVALSVIETWRSPKSVSYPIRWRIAIAKLGVRMTVSPRLEAQEWTGRVWYWEGAVEVRGTQGEAPLHGLGYAEFTGYA
ncbi:MAG: lipocalin-like domain-containing protein, partial [Gammaproteobacteria bacterium]